jgi:hypothetical protein
MRQVVVGPAASASPIVATDRPTWVVYRTKPPYLLCSRVTEANSAFTATLLLSFSQPRYAPRVHSLRLLQSSAVSHVVVAPATSCCSRRCNRHSERAPSPRLAALPRCAIKATQRQAPSSTTGFSLMSVGSGHPQVPSSRPPAPLAFHSTYRPHHWLPQLPVQAIVDKLLYQEPLHVGSEPSIESSSISSIACNRATPGTSLTKSTSSLTSFPSYHHRPASSPYRHR